LPQIVKMLGFSAAVHCTFDGGRFPTDSQGRIRWQGLDGTSLDALARVPTDVAKSDAFLRLPEVLGNAMDLSHAATMMLTHWPGRTSPWYEDVRRIAGYSPVLGKFVTLADYFEQTGLAGLPTEYQADQYRTPYLDQAVGSEQSDPISRWARYFTRRAAIEATEALDALAVLVGPASQTRPDHDGGKSAEDEFFVAVENALAGDNSIDKELDRHIQDRLQRSVARLGRCLGGTQSAGEKGRLLTNPWPFPRRLYVDAPELDGPIGVRGPVLSAAAKSVVVDVPPMGFAWVGPDADAPAASGSAEAGRRRRKSKARDDVRLAEENVLQNEYFRITFDPTTGAIRSIADYYSRGPRIAQQIAMRLSPGRRDDEGDDVHYSIMAADELIVTSAGPILGEMVSRGRLLDREARLLARFTQTTRVRRGSRLIKLLVDLDIDEVPGDDPWISYYAARFAWADVTSNLYRSVNLANLPTDIARLEAPHFVDIRSGKCRTTLLSGGLPYHRRFDLRKLDTLLVVRGETARRFRLGIGIDLPHPVPAALGFCAPETVLPETTSPVSASGWLFHLDCHNVLATHWEPVLADSHAAGFRVRLLETDGRRCRVNVRSFRPVQSAVKLTDEVRPTGKLPVEGDCITVRLGPHEWAEVEARFAI
jgi:alpha-mannosidase